MGATEPGFSEPNAVMVDLSLRPHCKGLSTRTKLIDVPIIRLIVIADNLGSVSLRLWPWFVPTDRKQRIRPPEQPMWMASHGPR